VQHDNLLLSILYGQIAGSGLGEQQVRGSVAAWLAQIERPGKDVPKNSGASVEAIADFRYRGLMHPVLDSSEEVRSKKPKIRNTGTRERLMWGLRALCFALQKR
jgi:hypothetical protein